MSKREGYAQLSSLQRRTEKGTDMGKLFGEIQPAVRQETGKVAVSTGVGVVLMWIVYAVLHMAMPEKVPFDYTVFLGGIAGAAVAVLNFLWMGLTVQRVVAAADEKEAKMWMKASYSKRMFFQMVWVIVAIAAPCFHFVAGILPLLFPSAGIKIMGIFKK